MWMTSVWRWGLFAPLGLIGASALPGRLSYREARVVGGGCSWRSGRGRRDADGQHPALVDLEHGEAVAAHLQFLADGRDTVHRREDEAGDGLEVALWQLPVEGFVQLVDPDAPGDAVASVRETLHHGRSAVVLVLDLAHDLLDDVLHGDDSDRAPVLVHHDRELHPSLLHLTQEIVRSEEHTSELQ